MRHTGFTSAFQDQLIVAAEVNKVRSKIALPTYALHACDAGHHEDFSNFSNAKPGKGASAGLSSNLITFASRSGVLGEFSA